MIAAIRGWVYVLEHTLYDFTCKAPSKPRDVFRVEAAVGAGLVQYTPLRAAVKVTGAGLVLLERTREKWGEA